MLKDRYPPNLLTAIRILASLHAVGVEPDPPEAHPTVVFRDGGPASTPAVPREAAIMRIADLLMITVYRLRSRC
jgi:hypothetical protein